MNEADKAAFRTASKPIYDEFAAETPKGKDMIDKAGIGLAPGSAFGPEGQGWLRWCFANRPETNAKGLERLAGYLAK